MAVLISTQALIAAFAFGIVVNAASAALFLNIKGHGSAIFRDGLRLVLITFLLSSALWAQIGFITTAIDVTASSSCQIASVFTTIFDQLARFSIEQYLLWAINQGTKAGVAQMLPQGVLLGRFVLGAVFVGFTKHQTVDVCAPTSSVLALGIVTAVFDALILAILFGRAVSVGVMASSREGNSRSKAIMWIIGGFAIWTATSVTLLLGLPTIDVLFRTAIPALGLSILIIIVTGSTEVLSTAPRPRHSRPPESPTRHLDTRDISTSDSDEYPPMRYEDLKHAEVSSVSAFVQPREAPRVQPSVGGGIAQIAPAVTGVSGVGGVTIQGALFPPPRAVTEPVSRETSGTRRIVIQQQGGNQKKSLFDLRGGPARAVTVGRLAISNPILESQGEQNPLNKIPTIDLETAVRHEKERRANDLQLQRESALIAKRPAPQPPSGSQVPDGMKRAVSLKRKDVASVASQSGFKANLEPVPVAATTTSAQLSPGVEEMRRRSPRRPPQQEQQQQQQEQEQQDMARPNSSRFMPESPMEADSPRRSVEEEVITVSMKSPAPVQLVRMPSPPATLSQQLQRSESAKSSKSAMSARAPSPQQSRPDDAPPKVIGAPTRADRATMAPQASQFQAPFYVPIRPSRQRAPSPEAPPPEGPKTALQRRPTIGLPGNPKSRAVAAAAATAARESGIQRQQTVMFVNNIVYDDPTVVQNIIEGVNANKNLKNTDVALDARGAGEAEFPLKSSNSVVNRPRPIPRKPEKDRAIFPAEPSPNQAMQHRRTKSGGSVISRKSTILQSAPGSPTQLPPLPLPPPPKSAGGVARPLPNNTKSMTFDEKMNLFYPGDAVSVKRRSSVPELPPVPANFFDFSETATQREDDDYRKSKRTTRTTKTSVKTDSILDVDEINRGPTMQNRYTDRSNPMDADSSWMSGIMDVDVGEPIDSTNWMNSKRRPSADNAAKRASSPVIPPPRQSTWTETTDSRTDTRTQDQDETATINWGSVHSPVAAVPVARQNAKSTYIQKKEAAEANMEPAMPQIPSGFLRDAKRDDRRGTMTIMLDDAASGPSRGFAGEDEEVMLSNKVYGGWHRRVGDDCPTFSERREKMRSRMPPPTPLLLGAPSTRNPVIVKAAEPSPLESPDQALQIIQDQLKKLDQPNRDSVESQGRRLVLLDNLEKEMDMQEGHWQDMKHGLSRDSLSTIKTSPTVDSRPQSLAKTPVADPIAQQQQQSANLAAERRAARREKMKSGYSQKSVDETASLATITTPRSSNKTRAGGWQQRLAEAQLEFVGNAPELLSKRNMNFLTSAQMGSPTPPDTDESDNEMSGKMAMRIDAVVAPQDSSRASSRKALWTPLTKDETQSTGLLWTPSIQPSKKVAVSAVPETVNVLPVVARQTPRREAEPLAIRSTQLWQETRDGKRTTTKRPTTGLWQPSYALSQAAPQPQQRQQARHVQKPQEQQQQKSARPVTIKPPRRSRRVTFLPDILESPEPLPGKRGTLGIFQFPWGERSDVATIHPRQTMFAMPGTMTSGGPAINAALEARARQLEAAEYSSSFFDDYDDDGDEAMDSDDLDEDGSDEGDDDFDETTLWEIASLLKTENLNLPSKNSLFPPPRPRATVAAAAPSAFASASATTSFVVDDYMGEAGEALEDSDVDEEEEDGDEARESIIVGLDGIMPMAASSSQRLADRPRSGQGQGQGQTVAQLWTAARRERRRSQHGLGLPHPDEQTWRRLNGNGVTETSRPRPRRSEEPLPAPVAEGQALWRPITGATPSLWRASRVAKKQRRRSGHGGKGVVGRPDEETWSRYDATKETVRARPRPSEPAVIESVALWTAPAAAAPEMPAKFGEASSGMWSAPTTVMTAKKRRSFVAVGHEDKDKKTSTNMAESLWAPRPASGPSAEEEGEGLFRVRPNLPSSRYTEEVPAGVGMVRKARSSPEDKSLDKLSSTSLWASEENREEERHWISGGARQRQTPSPSKSATAQKLSIPASTAAGWGLALYQAEAASYLPEFLPRWNASGAEWDSALREAVEMSGYAAEGDEEESPLSGGYDRSISQQDMIMAQIQALEEERLFAEQMGRRSLIAGEGEVVVVNLDEQLPPVPPVPVEYYQYQQQEHQAEPEPQQVQMQYQYYQPEQPQFQQYEQYQQPQPEPQYQQEQQYQYEEPRVPVYLLDQVYSQPEMQYQQPPPVLQEEQQQQQQSYYGGYVAPSPQPMMVLADVEEVVSDNQQQQHQQQLWGRPTYEATTTTNKNNNMLEPASDKGMWQPSPGNSPPRSPMGNPQIITRTPEDAEAARIRSSRPRKVEVESVVDEDELSGAGGMWTRPPGGGDGDGRDWLEASRKRASQGVVLRY